MVTEQNKSKSACDNQEGFLQFKVFQKKYEEDCKHNLSQIH